MMPSRISVWGGGGYNRLGPRYELHGTVNSPALPPVIYSGIHSRAPHRAIHSITNHHPALDSLAPVLNLDRRAKPMLPVP